MFNKNNFCHIASNNRNEKKAGVFVYKTTDDLATVSTSGYFNDKIIDINLHDLIIHEWHDATDRTKVQRNVLCVIERTLDNVGTVVIKSKWEVDIEGDIADIEQEIEDLKTYVNNTFVKVDGTSIMTAPLKFQAGSMRGAVGPYLNGVSFWKMDSEGNITNIAHLSDTQFTPVTDNAIDMGNSTHKWKTLYIAALNNGYNIEVPVTNSPQTLALKSEVDLAANSGRMITDQGVWYAKMQAATTPPASAEVEGRNYADFSQVDQDNNPIIVIYTYTSGAWTLTETITPPAAYDGYVPVTSKIWDIPEQAGQQGGRILWNHQSKEFTPYPQIVSFDNIDVTGESTVDIPLNPVSNQIVNKNYVDSAIAAMITTGIFEALYPVGSIYIGTQNTCPLATLIPGSTWTPVQGRYLFASGTLNGTSETYAAGATAGGGAPNITGNIYGAVSGGADGAFSLSNQERHLDAGSAGYFHQITFSASSSNNKYGASNTIRAPLYSVNVWRRDA